MRTSIIAMLVALGSAIALPAAAQQMTPGKQQMQDDANKGVKTRNSGESGYVAGQEKQGARVPGQSDQSQTTGSSNGTGSQGSGSGGRNR
ncbi:hypothetical protein [Bradyrhizobium neotropicale]|uniref:hypothetical protein n=1 Tax=Bradyrhizobium neotropicale TaxID=1497615 RepID=UPI001AD78AEA|nr:hypothetical protein [Bradyrhizobium neotropicale]MBO4222732.1 hypothetical protein [Bradyrhizobium neotropicale]